MRSDPGEGKEYGKGEAHRENSKVDSKLISDHNSVASPSTKCH